MASESISARNHNEGAHAVDQDELQLVSKIQARTEQYISWKSVKPVGE
jgi:hypothetical protein